MPLARRVAITQACDWCRQRKVKCDAGEVCANCRVSQLPCQYTAIAKKRGPKVPRTSRLTAEPARCVQDNGTHSLPDHESSSDILHRCSSVSATSEQHSPLSDSAISPQQPLGPRVENPAASTVSATTLAQAVRDNLVAWMDSDVLTVSPIEAVDMCIDLYMQFSFPSAPFIHEPTLRASAIGFFSCTRSTELFCAPTRHEEVAQMRSFALVTALCASVASVLPDTILSYWQSIADPCLNASREMLKIFEDYDVENPVSSSISTRLLHTVALQHLTGKSNLPNYILSEAAHIVQTMRLYSEVALENHTPLEAKLLRNLFWHMYSADKAAFCLGSRPISLHEMLFSEEMTVCPSAELGISLIDTTRPWYDNTFENRLLLGFQFVPRLWSKGASLLLGIKNHRQENEAANSVRLVQSYLEFLAILDSLPHWLQVSQIVSSSDDDEGARFQKTAFWVQRCTILVVFQCLRLVILQQCVANGVENIMGVSGMNLPLVKIGMVQDFINTLDDIPFVYLQVKGEPTVERIRWVGSILLEMLDTGMNEMITVRTEKFFMRLLDFLVRLGSKSSDVLGELKQSQSRLAISSRERMTSHYST